MDKLGCATYKCDLKFIESIAALATKLGGRPLDVLLNVASRMTLLAPLIPRVNAELSPLDRRHG